MTNMLIIVSAQFPRTTNAYTSDGISLSFGTSATVDATCSSRFCLNPIIYLGLATIANQEHSFARSFYSDSGISLTYDPCSGAATDCSNVTTTLMDDDEFKLVVAVTSGDTLTVEVCNATMSTCHLSSFRKDLNFSITSFSEALTY